MSKWAVRHPVIALVVWFVVILVIGGSAKALDATFNDSLTLPGVPSTTAQSLLERLGAAKASDTSITVVWKSTDGKVTDAKVRSAIDPVLKQLSEQPGVTCLAGPYDRDFGPSCPRTQKASLEETITAKANDAVAKATGISARDIPTIGPLLQRLAPLESVSPEKLGAVARALPGVAKLAQAPKSILDGLASVSSSDWKAIPGFTQKDADAVTAAFGGLDKAAQLPVDTLEALAKADPASLSRAAESVPGKVAAASKDWATYQSDLARLQKAARATTAATSRISRDERIAYATLTIAGSTLSKDEAADINRIIGDAGSDTLIVGAQGSALEGAGSPADNSEAFGLLAALLILLVTFGSVIAAGLPLVVAFTGLVAGQLLILVAAHFLDVASFAPELAAMIGLGVGIDYALFILNRYRQGLQSNVAPRDAALTAVGTAGRAVLFAGSTVIIALLGMFVLGIDFFNGLAVAAAAAVLMVMASALLFLPALLSLLGARALGWRMPWARHPRPFDPAASRWTAYGRLLQKAPIVPALLAITLVAVLAWPALSMRLGFPDDGTEARGTPLRTGFDLMSEGFGAGFNGPFFVAVKADRTDDFAGLSEAIRALERTPGVARTIPDTAMMPLVKEDKKTFGDDRKVTSILVIPKTSPQSPDTATLLDRIRDTTAPRLQTDHKVTLYVGGSQAVATDFTGVLGKALPVFLLLVVGLGFLALMLLFHSIVIPLTAALTSLLSFAGAMGVTVAVFQTGLLDSVFGVTGTGPILPFLPVMVFAILFGLSMDYQVFLVTRMQEAWLGSPDNKAAVRAGLAGSGRVVVVAASIMTCVFLSFVPTPTDTIKLFGVALASAVIIDAFIVRLVLVPSLMTMFGRANWWMPGWLGRILPRITLE